MKTNTFLIADLQIQWLKDAHKTLMQKNKLLFMVLFGSGEFILFACVFLLAQILAGHYSPLQSHGLIAVIGIMNAAAIQLTLQLLNSDFDQLWQRLPNQKRALNAARTSIFTLIPMLVFILPSGIFVLFASDFETQRALVIFQWLSIVLACFGLHFISIYQQKFRFIYALISIMIMLSAVNYLWWAAVAFTLSLLCLVTLLSRKIAFKLPNCVTNSWWLSFVIHQYKRILLHIALVLLAAALPLISFEFRLLISIIAAPLLFWFSHNNYQRFVDFLMLHPLIHLPNAALRLRTLKRQYARVNMLLIAVILGFYSVYDASGIFIVVSAPIILGALLLCIRAIPAWLATACVYLSALILGLWL
jgi:hypothetical protein